MEYRVSSIDEGGVFAAEGLAAGEPVEICPLLEVDSNLRKKSKFLKKMTLALPDREDAYAIPLGFARLYAKPFAKSDEPNLHWGFHGPTEVLLWAVEDVPLGTELTLDLAARPQSAAQAARKRPPTFVEPPAPAAASREKFGGAGCVLHGSSWLHGRGVFATRTVEPGQLIESCPAMIMDDGAAEALISYRWGVETQAAGPFYVPMGLGCLYNHSTENPSICARLDPGRRVLEFWALRPLHVGQEVLVNYGAGYFDNRSDLEGHRAQDLLKVDAPLVDDLKVRMFADLQLALIHAFWDEAIQEKLTRLRMPPEPRENEMAKERKRAVGQQWKQLHEYIMGLELPVLERFGFSMDNAGARHMELFIYRMMEDPRATPEMHEQNAAMQWLIRGA